MIYALVDHGGSGGEGSFATAAEFAAAWTTASAIDTDLLEAEAEDGGVEFLFAEDAANVRIVRVDILTNAVISNTVRAADQDELEKIALAGGVAISAADAVANFLATVPGATLHSVELEDSNSSLLWKIEYRDAAGVILETEVAAN